MMESDITCEGLTSSEVEKSRAEHGWNVTDDDKYEAEPLHAKILEQLTNPLIGLLLASALISLLLRQYENAVGIVVAVGLVGVVGAWQESKTEASVAALRQLAPHKAHVVRVPGGLCEVKVSEVVVGDVVEIRVGDRVPADLKMAQWNALFVDESILTGEAEGRQVAAEDASVYMGTMVSHGWGRGVVVGVGRRSKFGEMVALIQSSQCTTRTPLQLELDRLAHQLTIGSGLLIAVISVSSLLLTDYTTTPLKSRLVDVLTTAVSLAVAAIPEGLPLVSTVTMALAVRRLAHRHVIVKRLSAVEAMGSVSTVCFDKTGTLTVNRLTMAKFAFEEGVSEHDFLQLAATCTDVSETDGGDLVGNQLDCCLVQYYRDRQLPPLLPKTGTVMFSSERRVMQVTLADGRSVVKGAVGEVGVAGAEYGEVAREWSSAGLRVIAVGVAGAGGGTSKSGSVRFCGLLAFQDGIREGAPQLIRQMEQYGLTPVMLTGDSEETAGAVAAALHWPTHRPLVFGRQSPSGKLNFVKEHAGCAMVGDGVNDGAAVRRALVGVAMGGPQSTDVARQAADIVLSTDRLDGILDVVREGRVILVNVKRFLGFQLSSSMVSLLLVVITDCVPHFGATPLTPLHLLLLNIVMDGPPAQSLAVSRVTDSVLMGRPERVTLLDASLLSQCAVRAVLVTAGCLWFVAGGQGRSLLPPLLLLSMANAYSWTADDLGNPYLQWCLVGCVLFLLVCGVVPVLGAVVSVGVLGGGEWSVLAVMSLLFVALFAGRRLLIVSTLSGIVSTLSGKVSAEVSAKVSGKGYQKL